MMLCVLQKRVVRNNALLCRFASSTGTSPSNSLTWKELHASPPKNLSKEARLLVSTDPIGAISPRFNPWVIRVLKEFKDDPLENSSLRTMCYHTEKVLIALNQNIKKVPSKFVYGTRMAERCEIARRSVGRNSTTLIKGLATDREFESLAAFMTLLLPPNEVSWVEYDKAMTSVLEKSRCSIDAGLLAVNAINTAKDSMKFRMAVTAEDALLRHITRVKHSLTSQSRPDNVFDFSSSSANKTALTTGDGLGYELFTPIGAGKIWPNKELERLGLILRLLSHSKHAQQDYKQVMEDVTEYGMKVLSSLKNPAKLKALSVLWECAPLCNLPNSYLFYKSLYEQVLYSILSEPLQLVNEEKTVASLLNSMVASKFKNSQLIAKLWDIVQVQGMDYHNVGIDMFGSLVELDAMPFAMSILEALLDNSGGRFDVMFQQGHREERVMSMLLPDKAKEHLFNRLVAQTSFQYGDLAIAIHNYGRTENSKDQLALLNRIEVSLVRSISHLSVSKAIGLLYSYAMAGRYYAPIIEELNKIVLSNVRTMPLPSVLSMIWAAARLNDHNAAFLPVAKERYFITIGNTTILTYQTAGGLTRALWSLSALQLLDLKTFTAVRPLLDKFACSPEGHELHRFADMQLQQVWCEVQLLAKNENINMKDLLKDPELPSTPTKRGKASGGDASTNHSTDAEKSGSTRRPTPARKLLPWQRTGSIAVEETQSSRTHLDASTVLNSIGVTHTNEKVLPNGYIVDIFIPVSSLDSKGRAPFSGTLDETATRLSLSELIGAVAKSSTAAHPRTTETSVAPSVSSLLSGFRTSNATAATESAGEPLVGESAAELSEDDVASLEIPDTEIKSNTAVPPKGYILEFDGPTHFESYAMVSATVRYSFAFPLRCCLTPMPWNRYVFVCCIFALTVGLLCVFNM